MSQKPPSGGLKANTFSKLAGAREDTSPDIESMAAKVHEPAQVDTKRKNLVLRISPDLQKGLKRVSIDRDETVENMAIELLEKLVRDHKPPK